MNKNKVDQLLEQVIELCEETGIDAQSLMFSLALNRVVTTSRHTSPSAERLLSAVQAILMKPTLDNNEMEEFYTAILEVMIYNFGSDHAREYLKQFRQLVIARDRLNVRNPEGEDVNYSVKDGASQMEVITEHAIDDTERQQLELLSEFSSETLH